MNSKSHRIVGELDLYLFNLNSSPKYFFKAILEAYWPRLMKIISRQPSLVIPIHHIKRIRVLKIPISNKHGILVRRKEDRFILFFALQCIKGDSMCIINVIVDPSHNGKDYAARTKINNNSFPLCDIVEGASSRRKNVWFPTHSNFTYGRTCF